MGNFGSSEMNWNNLTENRAYHHFWNDIYNNNPEIQSMVINEKYKRPKINKQKPISLELDVNENYFKNNGNTFELQVLNNTHNQIKLNMILISDGNKLPIDEETDIKNFDYNKYEYKELIIEIEKISQNLIFENEKNYCNFALIIKIDNSKFKNYLFNFEIFKNNIIFYNKIVDYNNKNLNLFNIYNNQNMNKKLIDGVDYCCICYQNLANMLLIPCRHSLICYDCTKTYQKHSNRCPICRLKIDNYIKIK